MAPHDGFLTPIPEEGPQSSAPSLAPSALTVPTWNPHTSREKHILTVTFVLDYPDYRQSVVLPLPETYEGAIKSFCDFYSANRASLGGPAGFPSDPNKIVLEVCLGGYSYTAIHPSLWSQLVRPGTSVQVWTLECDGDYVHGPVYLCIGKRTEDGMKTVWTVPDGDDIIDCPLSYKQAVEFVKRRINKGGDKVQEWKNKDLTHTSFTFCTLHSFKDELLVDTLMDTPKKPSGIIATMGRWFRPRTMDRLDERVWRKLHPDSYDNQEAWCSLMPLPGACLGVIIEKLEERTF